VSRSLMRTDIGARRIQAAIRQALLTEWDPIGVGEIPEAQTEYDSYVLSIYKMLVSRKTPHEIFEYLWWVETHTWASLAIGRQQRSLLSD
jgi:hypothetical protein